MGIVTVIGARPPFIKAATVSRVIKSDPDLEEVLVHTGQHYDDRMSKVFFDELEIPLPTYNLGVGSGTHGAQTGQMLEAIEAVLLDEQPDWVLVYSDTNSTLAGALAAVKLHIPVAHVEAGLRSFNRRMPEEINRVLTDHAAALLFAPTESAVVNLRNEGIDGENVHLVGDVMYDAALYYARKASEYSGIVETLGLGTGKYVLTTIHRAENTDDTAGLTAIVDGLLQVADTAQIVWPLHPRTKQALLRFGLYQRVVENFTVLDPVGYLDIVQLENHAALIATDSGGVQKEAYFYRVPCVTLRGETEWVELIESGWNRVVPPTDGEAIASEILLAMGSRGREVSFYGEGDAAQKIVQILKLQGPATRTFLRSFRYSVLNGSALASRI